MLSGEHAEKLGLAPADLRGAPDAIIADGSKVRCWSAITPIRAQVLRRSPSEELLAWGPVFKIDAVFIEHADPLWGQSDFFATFEVTFWRNITPAIFGLSY